MPIESLKSLNPKQKALWEKIYKEQKAKGRSDATSAKIAWGVVKQAKETKEKSFPVTSVRMEKSLGGETLLEGYVLTYEPDFDNEVMSKEFAEKIYSSIDKGTFYHDHDSIGVLKVVEKKVDDTGIYAKVLVDQNNKYASQVIDLITKNPENLGFSVSVSYPTFGGKKMVQKDGKYYSQYVDGECIDFGITDMPKNPTAKAKVYK